MKTNKPTIEEKKTKAIELLKELEIYEPYIDGFKDNGYVCYFERFAGFWDFQNKELEAKRKEIEKKYKHIQIIVASFSRLTPSSASLNNSLY